jgi:iron complex transport system ATP-binding protein
LTAVELADRAREPFADLSIGQQQRAALARALAQLDQTPEKQGGNQPETPPRYLIADEPVSAMDPRHALAALSLLRHLAHHAAIGVVVVLHDLTAARALADDAVLLDESGRLAAQGPAAEVLTPAALRPVFGVDFAELTSPDLPAPALIPVHLSSHL